MNIYLDIILGIILGLDAFSLLVSLGSFGVSKKDCHLLIIIIGIFHFIFPLLGSLLGSFIKIPTIQLKILVYFFLMIEMSLDYFNHQKLVYITTMASIIILAFSVSIDSFSIGVSLALNNKLLLTSLIFSFCSITFSYIGLLLGIYLNKSIGKTANVIGILLIIIVLICQIINA